MYTLEEQAEGLAILDRAGDRPMDDMSHDAAWVAQYLDWYQVDEVNRWLDPMPRARE